MEEFGANLQFFGNKKTQTVFTLVGFLFHSILPHFHGNLLSRRNSLEKVA
jgi:hypothetical protein